MAKWGKTDFRQLKKFQQKLEKLSRVQYNEFCEDAAKELAARLLAKVIKRTPVGQYTDGRVGGTLRRGWTAGQKHWSEDNQGNVRVNKIGGATGFANSMTVKKIGNTYQIEVINPVEYAAYVEFGHRTANHKGWVQGRFMMTISASEVEAAAPRIIERKLLKFLKGAFD